MKINTWELRIHRYHNLLSFQRVVVSDYALERVLSLILQDEKVNEVEVYICDAR